MIKANYPYIFNVGSPYTRFGVKSILFWNKRDLYIELKDFNHSSCLKSNLIENMEEYNKRFCEKGDELLTLDYIDDIISKFEEYKKINSELSIFQVAYALKYYKECEHTEIVEEVFEFLSENLNVNIYDEPYYTMIIKNYPMKVCKLNGFTFISLNDSPAFVFDGSDDVIQINSNLWNKFIDDILVCKKLKIVGNTTSPDYRFPKFIEDVKFYDGDIKYVYVNDEFVEYDETKHSKDLPKFKKLYDDITIT